ncbi:MAG: hypothetical protein HQK51_13040, partial [Oligoflexia bacterium]|nr:hypothetical protein [Oligoflexia bacterium]
MKILNNNNNEEQQFSDYCPLEISHFTSVINFVPCDVYIKLTDTKFIKIINENELYDIQAIKKYENRGVKQLYIQNNKKESFMTAYNKTLQASFENQNVSLEDKMVLQNEVVSHAQKRATSLGLDSIVVNQMTQATNSVINIVNSNKNLLGMLKKMMKKEDYLS